VKLILRHSLIQKKVSGLLDEIMVSLVLLSYDCEKKDEYFIAERSYGKSFHYYNRLGCTMVHF